MTTTVMITIRFTSRVSPASDDAIVQWLLLRIFWKADRLDVCVKPDRFCDSEQSQVVLEVRRNVSVIDDYLGHWVRLGHWLQCI